MAKEKNNEISIPVLIILLLLFFPAAIIYVIVKLGGMQKTSEKIGENVKIIKENSKTNYNDLRDLKELLDQGVITKEEFDKEKQKILNR